MSKKVAVLLSGCGVFDGSEVHEAVITLLRLSQNGVEAQCVALDVPQTQVINHLTGDKSKQSRNILEEAGRIARGNIKSIKQVNTDDFAALIVPGGFGVAKNLSNFAEKGANCEVKPDVLSFAQQFAKAKKAVGLMCIAPILAPAIYGKGVTCTIGNDPDTATILQQMGAVHQNCTVADIVIDEANNLVTTPAYMLANSISEAAIGINKLVDKVLELISL